MTTEIVKGHLKRVFKKDSEGHLKPSGINIVKSERMDVRNS